MTTSFYITGGNCGLKFADGTYRDDFWNRLSAIHQEGAERIGNRTIRFYPARMKEGFEWPIGNGDSTNQAQDTSQKVRIQQHVQGAVPTPQPATVTTTNPFASMATNPTRPLPGLCPPPPSEMLAQQVEQAPPTVTPPVTSQDVAEAIETAIASGPPPAIEELNTATEIPKEPEPVAQVPEISTTAIDLEPPDKRTKEWKQWNMRKVRALNP